MHKFWYILHAVPEANTVHCEIFFFSKYELHIDGLLQESNICNTRNINAEVMDITQLKKIIYQVIKWFAVWHLQQTTEKQIIIYAPDQ